MRHFNFLIAVCVAVAVAACESDSPVEPRTFQSSSSLRAVTGITAAPVSPAEIDISWGSSAMQVDGFAVFRAIGEPAGTFSLLATSMANATLYRDAGLPAGATYCYKVRSFKKAGKSVTYSAYSDAACATTLGQPVNTPSAVQAFPMPRDYFSWGANYSSVRVNWTDNSSNEDGFRIEQAATTAGPWAEVGTTAANATSDFEAAETERLVCFRIIAFNAAGTSEQSSPDCTTPPAIPTNLATDAADAQSISLSWTDNSSVEDGYIVSRLGAGTWTDIATLGANALSYRDVSVAADVTYTYRVRAAKDGGWSDYSNQSVAVIATAPPTAPFGAYAAYLGQDEGFEVFELHWMDTSNNEEGFRIEYSDDGITGWFAYTTVGPDISSFTERYNLFIYPGGFAGCYRVVAFNDAGTAASNVTCAVG